MTPEYDLETAQITIRELQAMVAHYRSRADRSREALERLARIFEEEVQPYLPPRPGATYADGMNFMALNRV